MTVGEISPGYSGPPAIQPFAALRAVATDKKSIEARWDSRGSAARMTIELLDASGNQLKYDERDLPIAADDNVFEVHLVRGDDDLEADEVSVEAITAGSDMTLKGTVSGAVYNSYCLLFSYKNFERSGVLHSTQLLLCSATAAARRRQTRRRSLSSRSRTSAAHRRSRARCSVISTVSQHRLRRQCQRRLSRPSRRQRR